MGGKESTPRPERGRAAKWCENRMTGGIRENASYGTLNGDLLRGSTERCCLSW